MFVHDSLVELIRVGNTEVTVQNFSKEFKYLLDKDNNEITVPNPLEEQFEVMFLIIFKNSLFLNTPYSVPIESFFRTFK